MLYTSDVPLIMGMFMEIRETIKKLLQLSFFFTGHKDGSVYIKYVPLSFVSRIMTSVARLVALRHYRPSVMVVKK